MQYNSKPLFHLLMHIGKLMEAQVVEKLNARGLYHGQGRVLAALDGFGAITQAGLARGLGIKPATVTNMLQRMEKNGLVTRETDPISNRAVIVSLTPKGRKAAATVLQVWAAIEDRILQVVPAGQRSALQHRLESVRDAFGGDDPEFTTCQTEGDNHA